MLNPKGSGTSATELKMDDQLKTLFDYTKWHIGLYAGLITALIAVLQLYGDELSTCTRLFFLGSLFFFVLAGGAGGMVGSSIPFYRQFDVFMKSTLTPRREWGDIGKIPVSTITTTKWWSGKWWTHVEHLMFWLGISVALIGIGWNEISRLCSSVPASGCGFSVS